MEYNLEIAKNGSYTISIKRSDNVQYLHSRFVPEKEPDIFQGFTYEGRAIIVFGLGLGYHLVNKQYLLKTADRIFVIDPVMPLNEISQIPGLEWLSAEKVFLICGKSLNDSAEDIVQNINSDLMPIIIKHAASTKIFHDFFFRLEEIINSRISQMISSQKTRNFFSAAFFRNACKRLPRLKREYDISRLKGCFKGFSVIVVSSGPSLDFVLEGLRSLSAEVIIIAVDSALPVLKANKIEVDIVVSVDPQLWVEEHLRHTKAIRIESFSAHLSQMDNENSFLLFNSHPLSQICAHICDSECHPTSGSVAGDAVYCAILLGFSMICMVGMDFSFPHSGIYAKKTMYYERFSFVCNRLSSLYSKEMDYIRKGRAVTDQNVRTRRSFLEFKAKIEDIIKNKPQKIIHVVNGGLPLEGAEIIDSIESLSITGIKKNRKEKFHEILGHIHPYICDKAKATEVQQFLRRKEIRRELFKESGIDTDKYEHLLDYYLEQI